MCKKENYTLKLNCVMSARGRTITYNMLHMMCWYYLALTTYHVGLRVYSDKFWCERIHMCMPVNGQQFTIHHSRKYCFSPSCFDNFRYTFCECIPARLLLVLQLSEFCVFLRPYNLDTLSGRVWTATRWVIRGQEYAQLCIAMPFLILMEWISI
jgi:hypothetical protein